MRKIVINRCYGGFGISALAEKLYSEKKGFTIYRYKRKGGFSSDTYVRAKGTDWMDMTLTEDMGNVFEYDQNTIKGWWSSSDIVRDDPALVATVEELGSEKASERFAELQIVEIPEDVEWMIDDYDGQETVHEVHRSW